MNAIGYSLEVLNTSGHSQKYVMRYHELDQTFDRETQHSMHRQETR